MKRVILGAERTLSHEPHKMSSTNETLKMRRCGNDRTPSRRFFAAMSIKITLYTEKNGIICSTVQVDTDDDPLRPDPKRALQTQVVVGMGASMSRGL